MTVLATAAAIGASCSSSAPMDINFGKEAGTGFDAPKDRGAPNVGDTAGVGGQSGAGGVSGSAGGDGTQDAGGTGGVDAASDGDGGMAFLNAGWNQPQIGDNQYQYPNRLPNAGTA